MARERRQDQGRMFDAMRRSAGEYFKAKEGVVTLDTATKMHSSFMDGFERGWQARTVDLGSVERRKGKGRSEF